jgi:iron complex outermembrane recepter protein
LAASELTRRCLLLIIALLSTLLTAPAVAADPPPGDRKATDIPSQPLEAALQALAQDRNFQVVYNSQLVQKLRSTTLRGAFTRDEALTRLLAGTGLTFHYLDENTVTITPLSDTLPFGGRAPPEAQPGAMAVSASSPQDSLDEVLVTAQKRSERLQDIPASISVLSSDFLVNSGSTSFQDYLGGIPGVSYWQNAGQSNAIFIRGVSGGVDVNSNSTTGVYIDEAPVVQSAGSTVDLNPFDLERVEVLRGPQGTLYGAASMGGTVRLIMNKPQLDAYDDVFESKVSETEHGGTNYELDAMVNLPVTDTLGLRLVGGFRALDGFIDEVNLGRENANFDQVATLRALTRWQPTSSLDVLLVLTYQDEVYGAHPEAYLAPGYGPYQGGSTYPESGTQPFRLYSLTVNYDLGFASLTSASSEYQKRSVAVREYPQPLSTLGIAPGTPGGAGFDLVYNVASFSQELRLASRTAGPYRWLIGAFYSNEQGPTLEAHSQTNIAALQGQNLYTAQIPLTQHQAALFGEVGRHLTDTLMVTAGLRYSQYSNHTLDRESGDLVGGAIDTDSGAADHFVDQRYTLSYEPSGNQLFYAQAASGSRQGGPTGTVGLPAACSDDLQGLGFKTPPTQTRPDSLWTYEVGSKSTFAGERISLNSALYYTQWRDIQSTLYLQCGSTISSNAGAADIRGIELELNTRPAAGWLLSVAGAFTDTFITQPNASAGALTGDALPLVPKFNGSVSAQYSFPVFQGTVGYLRTDVRYVSGEYADFPSLASGYGIPAYSVTNARLGFRLGHYDIALYATNLFDSRIITFERDEPLRVTLATPLTVGVEFRMDH